MRCASQARHASEFLSHEHINRVLLTTAQLGRWKNAVMPAEIRYEKVLKVDLDQECLSFGEYSMFRRARDKGPRASLSQWRLDVHHKQDNWDHFIVGGFSAEGDYYLPEAEIEKIYTVSSIFSMGGPSPQANVHTMQPGPNYVQYVEKEAQHLAEAASPSWDTGESEIDRDSSSDDNDESTKVSTIR